MHFQKIHVLVKLATLIMLTITVRKFDDMMLLLTLIVLGATLICYRATNALHMLKRLRWLILTMLLVYAFNTPGEYVVSWAPSYWSLIPTYEGIQTGVSQCLRLCVIVAALALLLTRTSREVLIGGLYTLFKPLSLFNFSSIRLNPERFAVRLWLTLHYVESDAKESRRCAVQKKPIQKPSFLSVLTSKFDALNVDPTTVNVEPDEMLSSITIQVALFTWIDASVLFFMMAIIMLYEVLF